MTKRLSFLLLDANIIIELWRLGLWNKLVELCDIHVGKTVVGEADFFVDASGNHVAIDLSADIASRGSRSSRSNFPSSTNSAANMILRTSPSWIRVRQRPWSSC